MCHIGYDAVSLAFGLQPKCHYAHIHLNNSYVKWYDWFWIVNYGRITIQIENILLAFHFIIITYLLLLLLLLFFHFNLCDRINSYLWPFLPQQQRYSICDATNNKREPSPICYPPEIIIIEHLIVYPLERHIP